MARRLKRGIDDGAEPFDVFNESQDHVLAAARAHTERELLEAFIDGIERCPDPGLKRVLSKLCDLHALSELERDRGWFQEHGRISSTRAKMITRHVNSLCAELRPIAADLVDCLRHPRRAARRPDRPARRRGEPHRGRRDRRRAARRAHARARTG